MNLEEFSNYKINIFQIQKFIIIFFIILYNKYLGGGMSRVKNKCLHYLIVTRRRGVLLRIRLVL